MRYFKLIQKGFTPIDENLEKWIINYIQDNFDEVYGLINQTGYSNMLFFLIFSITDGFIAKESYCYGIDLNKMIPYLYILKEKLNSECFSKIWKIVNDEPAQCFELNKNNYSYDKIISHDKYKLYRIEKIKSKYLNLLKEKVINIDDTYQNIFKNIRKISPNIYIYGGAVRDLLLDIKPTDIDIAFSSDLNTVKKLCAEHKYPCSKIVDKYSYIIFGTDRGVTLEGHYKVLFFKDKMVDYDFTINQLVYDTKNNIIIDMTGYGIRDLMNKHINIPVFPDKYGEWANKNPVHPLIYFKLLMKGFKPINKMQEKFINNYIENNFDKIYMRKGKNGIEFIKQYIISKIGKVEIDSDGNYNVNPEQQKKILEYITTLSENLDKKYIIRIIDSF